MVRRGSLVAIVVAALAAALVVVAGGALLRRAPSRGVRALAVEAIDDHLRVLATTHPLAVETDDPHALKPWLSGQLDFSPTVPTAPGSGLTLRGAAVGYVFDHKAAVLVYRLRLHLVTLFAFRAQDLPWPDGARVPRSPVEGERPGVRARLGLEPRRARRVRARARGRNGRRDRRPCRAVSSRLAGAVVGGKRATAAAHVLLRGWERVVVAGAPDRELALHHGGEGTLGRARLARLAGEGEGEGEAEDYGAARVRSAQGHGDTWVARSPGRSSRGCPAQRRPGPNVPAAGREPFARAGVAKHGTGRPRGRRGAGRGGRPAA